MLDLGPADIIDRFLDPVADCWTPEVARRMVGARPDAMTEARLEELRVKANEGELSSKEREEYEAFVDALDLFALIKAKARAVLSKHGS
jgi:hypothetical protein